MVSANIKFPLIEFYLYVLLELITGAELFMIVFSFPPCARPFKTKKNTLDKMIMYLIQIAICQSLTMNDEKRSI